MNRIITFVIVLPLSIFGGNVLARKPAQSPRPPQKIETIIYANERTSVLPSYRGYRKPSIELSIKDSSRTISEKTVAKLGRGSRRYRSPKPTFELTPSSQAQAAKAAPVIHRFSRRVTRTEIAVPAPVISDSSRRIRKIKTPAPERDLQVSTPDVTEPDTILSTKTRNDVVKVPTLTHSSPKSKYRSLAQYDQQKFQQSQWKPQPKPVRNPEKVAVSLPVGRTSLQPTQAVAERTPHAEDRANVHPAAGKRIRGQKTAAGLWWFACALLVVPSLVLLVRVLWFGESHRHFETNATIDIPRQWNSPWENHENGDVELSHAIAIEARSREFHTLGETVDDLRPETELLDEIYSISSIASNSNSNFELYQSTSID